MGSDDGVSLAGTVSVTDSIGVVVARNPIWAIAGLKGATGRFRSAEAAGDDDAAHHAVSSGTSHR